VDGKNVVGAHSCTNKMARATNSADAARDSADLKARCYQYLHVIKTAVESEPRTEQALGLGRLYGTVAFINDPGIYADDSLIRSFADRFPRVSDHQPSEKKDIVHVISEAFAFGGHTRLMERLASVHTPRADLIVTRSTNIDYLRKDEREFENVMNLAGMDETSRLERLSSELLRYRTIVMHTAEDDFCAAVCAWRARQAGAKIFFVNHADHHFAFGREIANVILQVSSFGETLTRRHLPDAQSSFVGIPLAGKPHHDDSRKSTAGSLGIVSGGASWKFRPALDFSLPRVMAHLLSARRDARFTVIGARPFLDYWWWPLKLRYWHRVAVRGLLPYRDYINVASSADVWLDSYPVTGGTAFPEAVWSGKYACALWSGVNGWSPADELRVRTSFELLSVIENREAYAARLRASQDRLREVHDLAAVGRRYLAALSGSAFAEVPPGNPDVTFFTRVWCDRRRLNVPRRGAVPDRHVRRVLAKIIKPWSPALTLIGRLRLLRFSSVLMRGE